ncbi:MAG: nucleotide exchange factor GrpE [Lentisphaeria bacterium]|nr:nucleotide exchange factor GrpE [Lentisphaeria bacterium]
MTKKNNETEVVNEEVFVDGVDPQNTEMPETEENPSQETEEIVEEVKPVVKTDAEVIAELNDKILRISADFQNFKNRKIRDMNDARFNASCSVIEEFLTVFSHFNMAMQSVTNGDSIEIVQQGMNMISTEFSGAFKNLGVDMISAVGEKFDPNIHDAISKQASDEVEEGVVIQQWKPGYKYKTRLLQPATVVVSSGPAKEDEESK